MRHLILSDIHSNLEALDAVLLDAQGQYDEILCCGDVVGYNASPAAVTDWARQNANVVVRGNHDRVCARIDEINDFNNHARAAASWTHHALTPEQRAWLRALPAGPLAFDDFEIAHGSPLDEDEYLVSGDGLRPVWDALQRPLCFIGHTHIQGGWRWSRAGLAPLPRPSPKGREIVIELDPDSLYLVNPGSVGQPRDRDPRAAYAIWDAPGRLIISRRVPYNIAGAQRRILASDLPPYLAERLALGR